MESSELERWLAEEAGRLAERSAQRAANNPAALVRPEESALRKLESSLKKNTAFIKKLKGLTEGQREALEREFLGLNLSKYVEEIAGSLAEVKLKMTDVPAALHLACLAHRRYAEFADLFLDRWKRLLPRKKTDKVANASKLRVDLRFFADLVMAGVFPEKEGLGLLGAVLTFLVQLDKKEHANLPTVLAFARHCGADYTGLLPRSVKEGARAAGLPVPRAEFLGPDKQKAVEKLLLDYLDSLAQRAVAEAAEVKRLGGRNKRLYISKGEVFEDAEERYEKAKAGLGRLMESATELADLLDKDPPPVDLDAVEADGVVDESMIVGMETFVRPEGDEGGGLFEDEDTRQFYETLPELKELLPSILYKDSMQAKRAPKVVEEEKEEDLAAEVAAEVAAVEAQEAKETTPEAPTVPAPAPSSATALANALEEEEYGPRDYPDEEEDSAEVSTSTAKAMMDAYLISLPNLVNRDLIDAAAMDFVTNHNVGGNRRRLARALFDVPRTRLDLLPFYGRLIAILTPVMPDLGYDIADWLRCQFKAQLRRKDQVKIESKIKTARFIAELTKFKVMAGSETLHCLKTALFDLRHHAIDMSCALLESCGYFLFHSPDTHQKTKILLALMMRKRAAMVEQRYQLMIDNAFFATNPPPLAKVERKKRPPLHEYIRQLLFKDLCKASVEKVLKQLRKLPWHQREAPEVRYALRALCSPDKIKYSSIQWLASIVAGLMWYHDWVGYQVVDGALEELRLGCELNDPRLNQRRLANLKYLGEMYNYRVIDSSVVFNALYTLLLLGAETPLDPPVSLFRLRLVAALLDACGEYFSAGSSARKLDCFLAYLQRYYWRKRAADCWDEQERPFPVAMTHLLLELFEKLRPNLRLHPSLEEAEAAVETMETELREKVAAVMGSPEAEAELGEEEEDGLAPIDEDAEGEEWDSARSGDSSDGEGPTASSSGDDDEAVHVHRSLSHQDEPNPEDEDFCAALDKLMNEAVVQRVQDGVSVPVPDISVPANVRAKLGRAATFEEEEAEEGRESPGTEAGGAEEEAGPSTVRLSVLTRGRGGKVGARGLRVPAGSSFVAAWQAQAAAEAAEKERIKAATLSMSRRMEAEEAEAEERAFRGLPARPAMSAQAPQPHGPRPQRRPKFHHPKGAPATKDIFGEGWK